MKNILIAAALLLGVQLHAATTTVRFIDTKGMEPQEQKYDQNCQLVDATTGVPISDNTVVLHIGDTLKVNCPVAHGWFTPDDEYCLNQDEGCCPSFPLKTPLNALVLNRNKCDYGDGWYFTDFNFTAKKIGTDSLDINFMTHVAYCMGDDGRMLGHQLGHIEVQVIDDAPSN